MSNNLEFVRGFLSSVNKTSTLKKSVTDIMDKRLKSQIEISRVIKLLAADLSLLDVISIGKISIEGGLAMSIKIKGMDDNTSRVQGIKHMLNRYRSTFKKLGLDEDKLIVINGGSELVIPIENFSTGF